MARFEKRVVLVTEYGEEVCELKHNEFGFWEIPDNEWILMDIGDVYKVEERESEVE